MSSVVTPFEFFTVSHLIRIGNISAVNLNELQTGLKECSDESIFHHTFQTLSSHHYLTEGFSNDFAQWVLADASRDALAEQLVGQVVVHQVGIDEYCDKCRQGPDRGQFELRTGPTPDQGGEQG